MLPFTKEIVQNPRLKSLWTDCCNSLLEGLVACCDKAQSSSTQAKLRNAMTVPYFGAYKRGGCERRRGRNFNHATTKRRVVLAARCWFKDMVLLVSSLMLWNENCHHYIRPQIRYHPKDSIPSCPMLDIEATWIPPPPFVYENNAPSGSVFQVTKIFTKTPCSLLPIPLWWIEHNTTRMDSIA